MVALEQQQAQRALIQQVAAKRNQLTETQSSLNQLPTVMAQKVQALRNDLAGWSSALPRSTVAAPT